jgi:hypothetical protein
MRTVQKAAKDEKNWRAAVWWLERRSPERFGSRSAGAVTARHLKAFLTMAGDVLNTEIRDPTDRERVMSRLTEFQTLVDDLARDEWQNVAFAEEQPTAINASVDDSFDLTATGDFAEDFS